MESFHSSRLAKTAISCLAAVVLALSLGGSVADAQRSDRVLGEGPGRPDYELPDDYEPPQPLEASVRLTAETSDWSWPGVYDSAFRIDYTVTNTGDVRLNDFRIVEENANAILHDCYNYNQPLDPGESVSCTALLYQTTNPQTVRSIVYSRSDYASGWVSDTSSTTYTKLRIIDRPFDLGIDIKIEIDPDGDVAGGGLGGIVSPG